MRQGILEILTCKLGSTDPLSSLSGWTDISATHNNPPATVIQKCHI